MSQNLAAGAFLTTVEGRRCTAVPKAGGGSRGGNNGNANANANSNANSVHIDAAPPTTTGQSFGAFTVIASSDTSGTSTTSSSQTSATTITTNTNNVTSSTPSSVLSTSSRALAASSSAPPAQIEAPAQAPAVALVSTPSLPAPAPDASTSIPILAIETLSQGAQPAPSSSVTQTSEADNSVISTAPEAAAAQPTSQLASAITNANAPAPTVLTEAATPLFTTIGSAQSSSENAAQQTSDATNGAISAVKAPNPDAVRSTVAVAGGVIGGVVALSIVAFFVWWWRRRVLKKRRSTLLTPLTTTGGPAPSGEKGAYGFNRSSIGPTPMTEKVRNAIGDNVKRIRGRVSRIMSRGSGGAPSVDMNRGNSQFIESSAAHSRGNSSALGNTVAKVTTKDRFIDWWTRLTADVNFNWRLRGNRGSSANGDSFGATRRVTEKSRNPGSQPDFLTLLGMEERELDREAQRRRASVSRQNGSASSTDNFLGGFDLSFNGGGGRDKPDDPFSDANALPRNSAKPAPLVVSQPNNPFSDLNAIPSQSPVPAVPKPSTYVADIRRSRGQSASGNGVGTSRPPSGGGDVGGVGGVYRESVTSVDSYAMRRNNKFRSDPFDLERPELLAGARQAKVSMSSSTAGTAGSSEGGRSAASGRLSGGVGTGGVRRPTGTHAREGSFSSKYSSGMSLGDWSDPGPDVGPAAVRKEPRESPTQGWRSRLEREAAAAAAERGGSSSRIQSGGSVSSVGKAM
ncbi:hypothetical protein VTK73DRAFT_6516 [Phialemonium thermophilum]|uniref:Uncharacterized protein n=1 Tax=Phialemonium thermophilum TaxID=223376 RepID=A0ABR3WJG8_9PEZI